MNTNPMKVVVVGGGGGGGGDATPGGDNTELQYNDNGTFDGVDTLKYDGTNLNLSGNVKVAADGKVNVGIGSFDEVGTTKVAILNIDGSTGNDTPTVAIASVSEDVTKMSTVSLNNAQVFFGFIDGSARISSADISHTGYVSSRDDSGETTPENFLYTNDTGVLKSAPVSSLGGGGGSPGGDDAQLQYNNDGSFSGIPGLTYDGTNLGLMGNIIVPDGETGLIGSGTTADFGTKEFAAISISGAQSTTYAANADATQYLIAGQSYGGLVLSIAADGATRNIAFNKDGISSDAIRNTVNDSGTITPINLLYTDDLGVIKSLKPPASGTYVLQSVDGVMSWVSA